MVATRASQPSGDSASSPSKGNDSAGTKRKQDADANASPERDTKVPKNQPTIDSMLGGEKGNDDKKNDSEMKEATQDAVDDAKKHEAKTEPESAGLSSEVKEENKNETNGASNGNDQTNNDPDAKNEPTNEDAIEKSSQRGAKIPSSILEKGLIYFFTRNRVSISDAQSVGDLQRTFFVLRPLPKDAKLGSGPIPDAPTNRLLALPKKVFPKSHTDRFMSFVEKAQTSIADLKTSFLTPEDHDTKTQGTRHTDPPVPVAEGVYLLTRTEDATSHLVYATTIPSAPGELQEDLGIKSEGSFIVSVKNPERSGPASASLPQKAAFGKELMDAFRGRAWCEAEPAHLDHENCQILLIGEERDSGVEATQRDEKKDLETPAEEIELLEHEDELRVERLSGDDSVFDDLRISREEFSKVPTTW